MTDAEKAYAEAERLIEEARLSGATELDLSSGKSRLLHELDRIPDSIGTLTALTSLSLSDTQINDLSHLATLTTLISLELSLTRVSYLAPLAPLNALTSLDLWGTPVADLAPLAALTALTSLNLSVTSVTDLAPLATLTALTSLDLMATEVTDLAPLAGLTTLTSLDLSVTRVTDLAPLAALTALTSLDLSDAIVTELAPLATLTALTSLDLSRTWVTDLTPLARLTAITQLRLTATTIDTAALRALRYLRRLATHPGPDKDRGLTFTDTPATREDPRIEEIADIEDPSERARTLFEYLGVWEEEAPPEAPPQTTDGLRYGVGPQGAVTYAPVLALSDLATRQMQMHGFLLDDCRTLMPLFADSDYPPHAAFADRIGRYLDGLGNGPQGMNISVVWKVGNDLRLALEADTRRHPGDLSNRPNFHADQRSGLAAVVATHNVLVAMVPELADLDATATDPARRHVARHDAALITAAIDAFAAQVRLVMAEVTIDLRDLLAEAQGEGAGADRADRITQESLENLIRLVVAEAIAQQRDPSLLAKVGADTRSAMVGGAVGSAMPAVVPVIANTFPQLVAALHPELAAVLSAWHGAGYPVTDALKWVVAKAAGGKERP